MVKSEKKKMLKISDNDKKWKNCAVLETLQIYTIYVILLTTF